MTYGCCIGNVRDGDKTIGRVFEPQDDVEGDSREDERRQEGEIIEERRRIARDRIFGNERLALNAGKETSLRGRGD